MISRTINPTGISHVSRSSTVSRFSKGTVRGFFTGGYTEVRLLFTGPDGFPQPGYYKLDDIGKKLFYTAAEAAALAKSMTEKYERTWGWIGAPEIPMARPWEKLLEVPANG